MNNTQIHVKNLSKSYRVSLRSSGLAGAVIGLFHRKVRLVEAIKDISFSIQKGELVGYLGPNGAGKSTTIKILSGILVPDAGECRVAGFNPWKDRRRYVSRIGVVFGQKTQLWWDLPVRESLDLLRDIYRMDSARYERKKAQLTEMLELKELLPVPARQLSLGQRMRCDLAASLIHNPEILFLDEPTIGLDATAKLAVRRFITRINREEKTTVILTTHDMDDIEALCTRLFIIGKGQMVFDGTISSLRQRIGDRRSLTLDLEPGTKLHVPAVIDKESALEPISENRYRITFSPDKHKAADLIGALSQNNRIHDLTVENQDIEEIIARLYKEMNEEEAQRG